MDNSINNILKVNFKTLPLQNKIKIKELGRPPPELNLIQRDKTGTCNFTRHFSK